MQAKDLMEKSADELVEILSGQKRNTTQVSMVEREFKRRELLLALENAETQTKLLESQLMATGAQIRATQAQEKSAKGIASTVRWTMLIGLCTFAAALIAALVASGYAGKDAPLPSTVECQSGSQHIYDSDGNFKACISIKELEELE